VGGVGREASRRAGNTLSSTGAERKHDQRS